MQALIAELRRRNVFRVAAVYGVVGWVIAQVAVVLETALALPGWFDGLIVTTLLLGFPVALLLAWLFELTDDGFKPTDDQEATPAARKRTRNRLNIALGSALAVAIAFIAYDQTVGAHRHARATPSAPTEIAEASIAVLPFRAMGDAAEPGFLGDGIAEELMNLLAQVEGLRVASRNSAFAIGSRTTAMPEIAETLNVAHVLDGSVRQSGNRVRVTSRLVDTASDKQIWSNSYDRELTAENLFDIQDEIARGIIEELQGQLQLAARGELPTISTDSYSAFLAGRAKIETRRREAVLEGLENLQRAVSLDPEFAEAHIYLARAYAMARIYADRDHESSIRLSDRHLAIAQDLDPDHPRLAVEQAWNVYARPDVDPSEQLTAFEKAVELHPQSSDANRGLAVTLSNLGRLEDSIPYYERALEIDPASVITLVNAGNTLRLLGRPAEAKRYLLRALRVDPGNVRVRERMFEVTRDEGDLISAHRILKSADHEPLLRARLIELYHDIGFIEPIRAIDPDAAVALEALRANDIAALESTYRRISPEQRQRWGFWVAEYSGDPGLIRSVYEEESGLLEFLTGPEPITSIDHAEYALAVERGFADTGPEKVGRISQKLDAFFTDQPERGLRGLSVITSLSRWQAGRVKQEDLYRTLEGMLQQGLPLDGRLHYREFDPYREDARFLEISKAASDAAAAAREAISKELAAPPAVWWEPGLAN